MTMTAKSLRLIPAEDTPEDIAEMLAEAARVDSLFRSGEISTMFVPAIVTARCDFQPQVSRKDDARIPELVA
jgi:hypothetical protein